MVEQIVFGSLIVLMFLILYKVYKINIDIKELIIMSLFVVVASVLNMYSLMVPVLGFSGLKIGFAMIPMMIGGMSSNPTNAFLMGLSYDLLGLIVKPTEFPFLGFTFINIMMCVMPSLIKRHLSKISEEKIYAIFNCLLIIITSLVTIYLLFVDSVTKDGKLVQLTLNEKLLVFAGLVIFVVFLIGITQYFKKKFTGNNNYIIWAIIVISVEILLIWGLTSFVLQLMYGIPWIVSLFLRMIKSLIMIPLFIFVGNILIRNLKIVK